MSGPHTISTVNIGDLRRARERLSKAAERVREVEALLTKAEEEWEAAVEELDLLECEE